MGILKWLCGWGLSYKQIYRIVYHPLRAVLEERGFDGATCHDVTHAIAHRLAKELSFWSDEG